MLEKIKAFIEASKAAQLILVLLGGMAIGAIMYPTKHIEERLTKIHQEEIISLKEQHQKELDSEHEEYLSLAASYHQYHDESESKISSLTTQITTLKSHQKTAHYKLVKPDGTIEERDFTDTDIDESNTVVTSIQQEFKEKVDSIEKKWEKIHKDRVVQIQKEFSSKEEDYKKTIDELHKEKVVDINKKSFGIEGGILTNKDYYGHVTYDVFGPFFVGAQGQFGLSPAAGLGVGIRF